MIRCAFAIRVDLRTESRARGRNIRDRLAVDHWGLRRPQREDVNYVGGRIGNIHGTASGIYSNPHSTTVDQLR